MIGRSLMLITSRSYRLTQRRPICLFIIEIGAIALATSQRVQLLFKNRIVTD